MNSKNRILLIAFAFPPFNSIGSRRWAKISKYLAREGHEIFVIASENPYDRPGNWISDISDDRIQVAYLKYNYPKALRTVPSNLAERVYQKIYKICMKRFVRGNLSDESIFWEGQLLKTAGRLIDEHEIGHVICTAPPFRVSYFTSKLKVKYPNLKILCDFRDVWLDGRVYGRDGFSKAEFEFESSLENYVLKMADWVSFTDAKIVEQARLANPQIKSDKFFLIPHAFDPEDYENHNIRRETSSVDDKNDGLIRLVFGGTITTPCIEEVAVPLWKALNRLKVEKNHYYKRLRFIFYQSNVLFAKRVADFELSEVVEIRDPVPEELFFSELKSANFLVSILADFLKDYITTKNISYLPFRKPIVLISNKGRASDMILDNGLGYLLEPNSMYETLIAIIEDIDTKSFHYNKSFELDKFSFPYWASRISDLLN